MPTGIRNAHRLGDWLLVDMESGLTEWASDCVKRWDGIWVRADQYETRHPQEFVKAGNDPRALIKVNPTVLMSAVSTGEPVFIGTTSVLTRVGPATHIFSTVVDGSIVGGIGEMAIETSFVIA